MKNLLKLIVFAIFIGITITALAINPSQSQEKQVHFKFKPSLGLTFGDSKNGGVHTSSLQWMGTINTDLDIIGKKMDFSSSLFMTYGESKSQGQPAVKQQDAFILSLTPSVLLIKVPAIRLFLETSAETCMGKGDINGNPTGFFDPFFLYETFFVGQKHYSYQGKENTTWELTYGVGYSFQQTMNHDFHVLPNINGSKPGFENGYSGLVEFSINSPLTKSINFVSSLKAVILSRNNFFKDINASRQTILFRIGLYYKMVGLEYNYHFVHDLNMSASNMADQSLMITLTF